MVFQNNANTISYPLAHSTPLTGLHTYKFSITSLSSFIQFPTQSSGTSAVRPRFHTYRAVSPYTAVVQIILLQTDKIIPINIPTYKIICLFNRSTRFKQTRNISFYVHTVHSVFPTIFSAICSTISSATCSLTGCHNTDSLSREQFYSRS